MSAPPHIASSRRRERPSRAVDPARHYADRLTRAFADLPPVEDSTADRDFRIVLRQAAFSATVLAAGPSRLPYEEAVQLRREVLGPLLDARFSGRS